MSEHTPGPWAVSGVRTRETRQPVLQIYGPDDKVYALVLYSDRTDAEHIASHADARLIAAAPDLLDACRDCLENRGDWLAKMSAAIAKAKG